MDSKAEGKGAQVAKLLLIGISPARSLQGNLVQQEIYSQIH